MNISLLCTYVPFKKNVTEKGRPDEFFSFIVSVINNLKKTGGNVRDKIGYYFSTLQKNYKKNIIQIISQNVIK